MTFLSDFRRVTKAEPCPICEKPDWCLVSRDEPRNPSRAICARVESDRRAGDAGWFHRLHDDFQRPRSARRPLVRHIASQIVRRDLEDVNRTYQKAIDKAALERLALDLAVSVENLRQLGIGCCGWGWTFPMLDLHGLVCGIRVRRRDGRKLAIKGSRDGLFIPADLKAPERLFICEGLTDTAALLDLGLAAIGRPNCQGGMRLTVELIRQRGVQETVIVADRDLHGAGQRGATLLASRAVVYVPRVRIVMPPVGVNDVREWVRRGAGRRELLRAVDEAPVQQLKVQAVVIGGTRSHGR